MKKAYALAAFLAATPALAQEKPPCAEITQDFQWNVFTITQRANTVDREFCLKFTSDNENIKQVLVKITDDATGVSTVAEEGCLKLTGAQTQGLTPMVIQKNGEVVNLMTLRLPQAIEVYNAMVGECAAHPSSYQPVGFKVPSF